MKRLFVLLCLLTAPVQANSNLETAGDVIHLALPISAFAATIFYEDNDVVNYEGTWQLVKAAISSRLVVEGLKLAVDKDRPDNSGQDSFPSGHTNDAFMAATFIQQRYGSTYGIPAYLGATFVGYSRVESDKHYTEDVLVGAAIGSLASWYFTKPYAGGQLTMVPQIEKEYMGMQLNWRY